MSGCPKADIVCSKDPKLCMYTVYELKIEIAVVSMDFNYLSGDNCAL